jgi:arsenite/tail-anchored protein-transporting ATPase
MGNNSVNIFFLGKGGVGKSTSSSLTAVQLANCNKDILLVSMDPAHNQSDIFEKKFSEKPYRLKENLIVKEIEINYWIKKYLREIESHIKRTYSYLTALNIEKYFSVLKYSPGIEEYALLMAFAEIKDEFKKKDYIIFDMPPTALTLKFFGLPKLSLVWLEKLLALRNDIIKKREIITKVKFGNMEFERDKILNKINQQIVSYEEIKKIFEDKNKTIINLVMNPDKLSFSESELIREKLREFDLDITNIIINKYYEDFNMDHIRREFNYKKIQIFPVSDIPLIGIDILDDYLSTKAFFDMTLIESKKKDGKLNNGNLYYLNAQSEINLFS